MMVLHGSPLILELLYSSLSMIIRHCSSCQDRSKVGRDAQCAWMTPYRLSLRVLGRQFTLDTDASWLKGIGTEVRSSIIILMATLNSVLLQNDETGIMFLIWSETSRSFMGRRRKMGRREREIRHLSKAYHSRNSPSSITTCRIGQILRSAMQLMVCTTRRICLVTQLGSSWRHLPKQGIRTSHDRTWQP